MKFNISEKMQLWLLIILWIIISATLIGVAIDIGSCALGLGSFASLIASVAIAMVKGINESL